MFAANGATVASPINLQFYKLQVNKTVTSIHMHWVPRVVDILHHTVQERQQTCYYTQQKLTLH